MNKLLVVGGLAVGAALLAWRYAAGRGGIVGNVFDRMPANSPRKRLLSDLSAIRANTERTLELLEQERAAPEEPLRGR